MAEKKIKKIDPRVIERFENALSSDFNKEVKKEKEQSDILENPIVLDQKESSKEEDISLEILQKQLDEANSRFLDVSEKLHALEAENSRLVAENNALKSQCKDLEERNSGLEDDIFNSNLELSEKLSKITNLEVTIENMKKGALPGSGLGILNQKTTVAGMNGYESWN